MAGEGFDMSTKISSLVESYIAYKRGLGFKIEGASSQLKAFARYTEEAGYDGPLTRSIVTEWCENGNPSLVTSDCSLSGLNPLKCRLPETGISVLKSSVHALKNQISFYATGSISR